MKKTIFVLGLTSLVGSLYASGMNHNMQHNMSQAKCYEMYQKFHNKTTKSNIKVNKRHEAIIKDLNASANSIYSS